MAQYKKDLPCIEPDCHRLVGLKGAKGRCAPCNQALRRAESRANPQPCSVPGCVRKIVNAGTKFCDMHRNRHRRHGTAGEAAPLIGVRGEGFIRKDGYRTIARIPEHRSAMEKLLGRPLKRSETVHHVNGQRSDNRTNGQLDERYRSGNLELWSSAQPAGQRVVDKIEFAIEILREYAPHMLKDI